MVRDEPGAWSEADAKAALARQRDEHVAVMEELRGSLGRLRSSIVAAAEQAASERVGIEASKQAEVRREAADYRERVSDGLAAAIRAVPEGHEHWDASMNQKARLGMLLDRHPNVFIADDALASDPLSRSERRETLVQFAQRQTRAAEGNPAERLVQRAMRQAVKTGTGVHLTLPTGERVDIPAERVRGTLAARLYRRGPTP
jgi:hypothetical protein